MHQKIQILKQELQKELNNILQYWMHHTIDEINGGFFGSVLNDNSVNSNAAKGVVLNARILWTFSAAYNFQKDQRYLVIAARAMHYIKDHFWDKDYGGVYWSVDAKGNILEDRKQIYGLAFCIYGMSEYYVATKNKLALQCAIELYKCIELHSYDTAHKGYFEAFSKDWQSLNDLRLSTKDANEKKTMNTHLHIIEAYANLYKVWPEEILKNKIEELLFLFDQHFINHETGHLRLFFNEQWNEKVDVISYGHDIEAAWLLLQCAEIIHHDFWIEKFKKHAITITKAVICGLDKDGGLWYEYDQHTEKLIKEKHWWPQAEAMIGFFNVFELNNDESYIDRAFQSWEFIKRYVVDKNNGEWYWGVNEDYNVMEGQDKAGFWKCPYHNTRACIEILKRIKTLGSV